MISRVCRCFYGITVYILLALYLFVFYELLLIPAILDWSLYGVLIALSLVGLLIWSIPPKARLSTTVLAFTFILILTALNNIKSLPAVKYGFNVLLVFFILLVVGKLLGHFRFRRYLTVFLVAVILNNYFDLSQARLWPEFNVVWESPSLYKRLATVDYFPIKLADVDGDGVKEIITQENLKAQEKEKFDVAEDGIKYQILQPENFHYAVYKWNGATFEELGPGRYNVNTLISALPTDYLGYPFYSSTFKFNRSVGVEQNMDPLLDRAQLVEISANFGAFPFAMLKLSQRSLEASLRSHQALNGPAPATVVATGSLIPGSGSESVTLDHILKVWQGTPDKNQLLASLDQNQIPDIGTSEVILGDVNKDQADELLLTAEKSRILKLTKEGQWQTLWASPEQLDEKARFQKFRFEDFAPLGKDPEPQIIALSKSNVRNNPTRYMTGYVYRDGVLEQKWRVFSGLINLRAGDIDGDGQNELVGYMYRAQRLFVLKRHHLPVVPALYTLTGGLILLGFGRRWQQRKMKLDGGEQNA